MFELIKQPSVFYSTGSIASVNEDSFSANSEDKINSSLTEEELKHDFRMVLPSENHRRKSLDCMDSFIMGNDTSSVSIPHSFLPPCFGEICF